MIELYTGDGKGKTTAATGLALRAAGSGLRVVFSQFMKGNDTGEIPVLNTIPRVTVLRSQKRFGFYATLTEAEKEELHNIHDGILERILDLVEQGSCDVVILDEITYPAACKLISIEKLQRLLTFGQKVELVLTGRDPADFMVECADYITEMNAVRHPYEKGVAARKGIEY